MPEFLERRLRAQARKKGFKGERADKYVYGSMNNMGAMHGSEITAKGREMEAKHERDTMKKHQIREIRIEVHRGKGGEITGHTVHHHMMPHASRKSGAFLEDTHHSFPFDAKGMSSSHGSMKSHIAHHLGLSIPAHAADGEAEASQAEENEELGGEERA
jgi:hypothetical protein